LRDYDSQAAEETKARIGEPGQKPGSFYLNLSIHLFDKGKPVEKQGRKAMDLPSRTRVTMTARPPKTILSVCVFCMGALINEVGNDTQHANKTDRTKHIPPSCNLYVAFLQPDHDPGPGKRHHCLPYL
jgi:hypothetical protein